MAFICFEANVSNHCLITEPSSAQLATHWLPEPT
jgi:hypothetical protein